MRDIHQVRQEQVRIEAQLHVDRARVDAQLSEILHKLNGNGKPGLLAQAKEHADQRTADLADRVERLAETAAAKAEALAEKVANMKVLVSVLAAAGAAGGSAFIQYFTAFFGAG
jgi:DNA uptake protein ComE-like DNA-binding protein